MSDKQCKIGVQLMPLLLMVLSAFYYATDAKIASVLLSVVALLMWCVLLVESDKNKEL